MFWPCVSGQPFRFRYAATDIDGRSTTFDLPAIFITGSSFADVVSAETAAQAAKAAWAARRPSAAARR